MTKKECADRNIGMTFDFIKQAIGNPEIISDIKDGAELNFIDKDMPIKKIATGQKKKIKAYKVGHIFEAI